MRGDNIKVVKRLIAIADSRFQPALVREVNANSSTGAILRA